MGEGAGGCTGCGDSEGAGANGEGCTGEGAGQERYGAHDQNPYAMRSH